MKCVQTNCDKQAEYIVNWPGKDIPSCKEHKAGFENIAKAMGLNLSTSKLLANDDEDK